ncbi:DUF6257 family protein [Streptomyces sp. NPDC088745]|uniref:DUF6257 family protein n=1 Tax=Streptomyces sp. NPDC088745 TaxID=3365884 RepID=UPI003815BF21
MSYQKQPAPPLTPGEKAKVAYYVARMCKREIAGPDVYQADLERKVERVLDGARKRAERNT